MRGTAPVLALLLALCLGASNAQTNTMAITDKTGSGLSNYPVQFGRPFKAAEISDYPKVLLDGTAVPTQADVKQRWGDGSVKHAVISFILPSLSAGASVTVTFQNQLSADGGSPVLTQSEMLNSRFNFDAVTEIVNTSTVSASARAMLNAGKYVFWTSGGIATTIVLADHSAARAYDMGFDSYKSLRPMFVATFWNSLNKVRVRYIGEVTNSEVLQDMAYKLNLRLGSTSPTTVYQSGGFLPHTLASRWTKIFWIGGAPAQEVDINYNTPYIIATRFLPNYNMTLANLPVSTRDSIWNDWSSASKDLYDAGFWVKAMPTTGGRDDIGLITRQIASWIFSNGDWRMREIALANADLASAWGQHVRECNVTRSFDKSKSLSGMGKIVSIYGRPTVWLLDYRGPQEEAVKPLTVALNYDIYNYQNWIPSGKQGWIRDSAHQPDPYYVTYMLTGDFYYLEQLQFWAGMGVLEWCVGASYCRGPLDQTKPLAGIQGQIRANAWTFRTRVNAAWISPDGTPERSYFDNVTMEAIAYWEGFKGIMGTQFDGTFHKTWALENIYNTYAGKVSQLFVFENDESLADGPVDPSICGAAVSMWMEYMVINTLGWAKERGYPTGPFLSYIGKSLINQITDGTWDPKCIALYRTCIRRRSDNYFYTTWAESIPAYSTPFSCSLSDCGDMNHGYGTMATAAASWLLGETGGDTTWTYLKNNCRSIPSLDTITANPKWMLIPRPDSIAPGAFNPAPPRVPVASSPARPNTPSGSVSGAPSSSSGPTSASTKAPGSSAAAHVQWSPVLAAAAVLVLIANLI